MAGGSALVVLLDEVATMVKVTAQKTTSIADPSPARPGDTSLRNYRTHDTGIILDVAKGSLRNKAVLVPALLALNFLAPAAVLPMLAAGGAFFAYEGYRKVKKYARGEEGKSPTRRKGETVKTYRTRKIRDAVRTDMILSAEIMAVTLAAVAALPFATQALVMGGVAVGATAAAYSLIAGIVKMEDLGGWMANRKGDGLVSRNKRALGRAILAAKPKVLKTISYAGTVAVFMVGGGLMFHGIPAAGYAVSEAIAGITSNPALYHAMKLGAAFVTGAATGLAMAPVAHIGKQGLKLARSGFDALTQRVDNLKKKVSSRMRPKAAPEQQARPAALSQTGPAALDDAGSKEKFNAEAARKTDAPVNDNAPEATPTRKRGAGPKNS